VLFRSDDIPIVIILKAMGLECDQEIVQLVGTEPEMVDLFSGSLEEPYNLGIYSQEQVRLFVAVLFDACVVFLLLQVHALHTVCLGVYIYAQFVLSCSCC
jgi:DNA-directed RNA polymerase beta subunit